MGLFFIMMAILFGVIILGIGLDQIKTELKYRNTLLKEQNEILKGSTKLKYLADWIIFITFVLLF